MANADQGHAACTTRSNIRCAVQEQSPCKLGVHLYYTSVEVRDHSLSSFTFLAEIGLMKLSVAQMSTSAGTTKRKRTTSAESSSNNLTQEVLQSDPRADPSEDDAATHPTKRAKSQKTEKPGLPPTSRAYDIVEST